MKQVTPFTVLKSIAAVLMFPMSCMALPRNGLPGASMIFGFGALMLLVVTVVEVYWTGPGEEDPAGD